MKALFTKDFCLLKMQKKFFIVIILSSIIMIFSTKDISFVMGYLTIIMPLFALSTISYDEFDNGNAFLFTLPINRKTYVIEKYCFGLLLGAISLVGAIAISLIYGAITDMSIAIDAIKSILPIFAVMIMTLSIMLPLQLKLGGEKSKIAIIALTGIAFIVGFVAMKLFAKFEIDVSVLLNKLFDLNIGLIICASIAIVLLILFISVKASISIMRKKEF